MKKAKILLLLLMTSTLMVACGSEVSNESNADTERGDNGYGTESSIAGEKGQIVETEGTEIALWEKYPIIPGSTWEYMVDDRTTIFANVVYNEDGSASVQGFAYTDNDLAEEYLIDKTLYTEDGIYYTTEDGNFDMSVAYSDSVEFVDWENGLFEGTFSLVVDEPTDDYEEVTVQLFGEEEIKEFFRDTNNIGTTVGTILVYIEDLSEYHEFYLSDSYFVIDTTKQSTILFMGDEVYVEGVYKGIDWLGNPYLELTYIDFGGH